MPTTKFDKHSVGALPGPADGKSEVVHWDEGSAGARLRVLAPVARTWIVRYRIGERSRVVALGKGAALSPADARKPAGAILAKAKLGRDTRIEVTEARAQASDTFKRLADSYICQGHRARRRASYLRDVRRYLLGGCRAVARPARGGDHPQARRRRSWATWRRGAPVAADRCRVALSAMFAWAMKQGLAEENPAAAVARIVEPKARERALSADELRAVWQATEGPGDFNAAVRLLLLTGQRRKRSAP